jgi:hypothetical protein
MNSFNTQNQCDEFDGPTAADWQEFAEWSAAQDAQRLEEVRQTFLDVEEDHTDEGYDAWRESQIHDGIWN